MRPTPRSRKFRFRASAIPRICSNSSAAEASPVDTFDRWESFYVIVGSAAGALIGLQFVVMTLIAERPPPDAERAGAAFSTPTIVHLCVVLGIAALLRVPWESIVPMTTICAFVGVLGVIYCGVVARRMRVQVAYAPDVADWLCRVLLPL